MKRMVALFLAVLMMAVIPAALAEDKKPSITAQGTGTVSLAADMANIQIGALTRAATVAEAQSKNDAIMNAVIAALIKEGVAKEDIITSQYNVNLVYTDPFQQQSTGTTEKYEVSNLVNITVRELPRISTLIDAAAKAGANNIYGLTFSSSKSTEAYQKALQRAVEDANARAKALAAAAGKELGDIISITSEQTYNAMYGASNYMDMLSAKAQGAAIVSGDVSVAANVTVTYAIKWQ